MSLRFVPWLVLGAILVAGSLALTGRESLASEQVAVLDDQAPDTADPAPSDGVIGVEVSRRDTVPAWQRFAVAGPDADGRPMIVLVMDDLGLDPVRVDRAVALDPRVTLAFLPYTPKVERSAWLARRAHHEILVHLPMEPVGEIADPGPNALLANLGREELIRRLYWNLNRFGEFVGVNNHMGSHLTTDWEAMTVVLLELHARGLLYLDSVTTAATVGPDVARDLGMLELRRDVFVDTVRTPEGIAAALGRLEAAARENGLAIGIVHPYDESFTAIEPWIAGLEARGLVLVPLSAAARRLQEAAPGS